MFISKQKLKDMSYDINKLKNTVQDIQIYYYEKLEKYDDKIKILNNKLNDMDKMQLNLIDHAQFSNKELSLKELSLLKEIKKLDEIIECKNKIIYDLQKNQKELERYKPAM